MYKFTIYSIDFNSGNTETFYLKVKVKLKHSYIGEEI